MNTQDIQKRFPDLLFDLKGDAEVDNLAPPSLANATSIVFVTDGKFLAEALAGPAATLVVHPKMQVSGASKALLFAKNVKLAMAVVKKELFTREIPLQEAGSIHPTAVIHASARLGAGVSVGPFCVIGQNVVVADKVRIDASVTIEADCRIGKDTHLYSNLYLGPRTEIGERCEIHPHSTIGAEGFGFAPDERGRFTRIPQSGKVVIENDVEVGANSTIDRATFGATRIGEGTKIDKQAHIAHNCDIGKHCVLAGKFAVAGSTKIGNHFIAGGRVTVKDNITVTNGVEIAGLSGVHNSIHEPGQYGGFPIQPVRDAMRSGMTLAHLPQMRKQLAKILKVLKIEV
jgi:UDP-3-O-[3-hydroxymyristoyl] glucosamine N-acyltransferase